MDSRKLRRKRPFPPFPISLITLLGVKKLNANAEMNFWMFGNNLAAGRYLHSPPRNRGLPRLRILILRKSGRPDLRWGRGGEGGTTNSGVCGSPPSLILPHKGGGNRDVGAAGAAAQAV